MLSCEQFSPRCFACSDPQLASNACFIILSSNQLKFNVFDRLAISIRTGKNLIEEGFVCSKHFDISWYTDRY
jgi:hypothetical protein